MNTTTIKIIDNGKELELDYQQALSFHGGNSIWGVTVTFRMLQLAARFFSNKTIWNRHELFIMSGHPGPGVRDALEFITQCVSNNRFELLPDCVDKECSRDMIFEWLITHGNDGCTIKLRENFIPEKFYIVLDRLNTGKEQKSDKALFEKLKKELSEQIWQEDLQDVFQIEISSINKNKFAHA